MWWQQGLKVAGEELHSGVLVKVSDLHMRNTRSSGETSSSSLFAGVSARRGKASAQAGEG